MADTAFDVLAKSYDSDFSETVIGSWLRSRVQARLDFHFGAGTSVLELGCGTGVDALHLVQRGVRVTATDSSEAMLAIARARLAEYSRAAVAWLDLTALPSDGFAGPLDGAVASFGPLNCMADWRPLSEWLASRIRPDGVVVLGVMGPLCLWEIGWHLLHGDARAALRRLRKNVLFQPAGSAQPVCINYPSVVRLQSDFSPYFRTVGLRGLGVFLPPGELYGVVEKRPRLLNRLLSCEVSFAHRWPFWYLGDHYLLELTRIPDNV